MRDTSILIVGAGIYGLSVARHALSWSSRVTLIDDGRLASQSNGSSGETRLFRRTILEDVAYGEFATYAGNYIDGLQKFSKQPLSHRTGFALIAEPGSLNQRHHSTRNLVRAAETAARTLKVGHRLFSTEEFQTIFPGLNLSNGGHVFWEPGARTLMVDAINACIRDQLKRQGARLYLRDKVVDYVTDSLGTTITLESGSQLKAKYLVLATGAGKLGRHRSSHLAPQLQQWFDYSTRLGNAERKMPAFVMTRPNEQLLFGFPRVPGASGYKMAFENSTEDERTLDEINDSPSSHESVLIRDLPLAAASVLPGVAPLGKAKWAHYVNMPGSRITVSRIGPYALALSGCSGHGYKLAPGVARRVSDAMRQNNLSAALME